MSSVFSAEKPYRLLASFWSVVRSYKRGGCSLVSLRSTFTTRTVRAPITSARAASAFSLPSNFSVERTVNSVPSFAVESFSRK